MAVKMPPRSRTSYQGYTVTDGGRIYSDLSTVGSVVSTVNAGKVFSIHSLADILPEEYVSSMDAEAFSDYSQNFTVFMAKRIKETSGEPPTLSQVEAEALRTHAGFLEREKASRGVAPARRSPRAGRALSIIAFAVFSMLLLASAGAIVAMLITKAGTTALVVSLMISSLVCGLLAMKFSEALP